jgi:hypothetical protein
MDKPSHTILYANDTNNITTSTDYNDLQKRVNLTIQTRFELIRGNDNT